MRKIVAEKDVIDNCDKGNRSKVSCQLVNCGHYDQELLVSWDVQLFTCLQLCTYSKCIPRNKIVEHMSAKLQKKYYIYSMYSTCKQIELGFTFFNFFNFYQTFITFVE